MAAEQILIDKQREVLGNGGPELLAAAIEDRGNADGDFLSSSCDTDGGSEKKSKKSETCVRHFAMVFFGDLDLPAGAAADAC